MPDKEVELCPDPISCCEKGCQQPVLWAFITKQDRCFRFCCIEHKAILDSISQLLTYDSIDAYSKRRKRGMYNDIRGMIAK